MKQEDIALALQDVVEVSFEINELVNSYIDKHSVTCSVPYREGVVDGLTLGMAHAAKLLKAVRLDEQKRESEKA